MEQSPTSLLLNSSDKLLTLRRLDQFRNWVSLDDQRRCLKCGRLITGRQIELVGNARDLGLLEARCPTKDCTAIPLDWALPRDSHVMIPGAEEEAVRPPARDGR